LFNSLGWMRHELIVIPVNRQDLVVTDASGAKVTAQISVAMGPNTTARYELFFHAMVGPLGFNTYFVSAPGAGHSPSTFTSEPIDVEFPAADTILENSILRVTVSGTTGLISSITNKKSGVNLNVQQNLMRYTSSRSGAYAFTPTGAASPVTSSPPTTVVSTGPIVNEVHQTFTNYAKQTIRLFNASGNADIEGYLEINFDLGPLPSHSEIVASFSTPLQTQRTITTDDNGFEFLTRQYNTQVDIGANYYPMVYGAYINDEKSQLTLISERSHGAGGPNNGELEVMVHRNPDMGDGFGPGLTDTTRVFPVLRVLVDSPSGSRSPLHHQPYFINFPLTVFTGAAKSAADWSNAYVTQKNFLNADLPSNVHFLSLNALDSSSKGVIVRLTHLYATGEDPVQSQPVTIDLTKLFSGVTISSGRETTLSANKDLSTSLAPVVLNPKEIRTFVVEFAA